VNTVDSLARRIVRRVRKIEFRARGRVSDPLSGGHLSAFRGTGMRFREVRSYVDGDDPRSIDWNVTARLGEPFVKVFEEERELTAAFIVDLSGSMDAGSRGTVMREAAAEFCAVLALSCLGTQESLALLTHTDRVESWLPPFRGPQVLSRVLREILERPVVGRGTDLSLACDQLGQRLTRRSVVFVVSDFRDDPARYAPALRRLGVRHDLNLVRLEPAGFDPLPGAGLVTFLDPESGAEFELDTSDPALRRELSKAVGVELDALLREAKRSRAVVTRLRTGADPLETVRTLVRSRALAHGEARG
jgi:uncharacterized protein (DUF58 family)